MNDAIAAVGSTLSWIGAIAFALVLLALFVLGGLPSGAHRHLASWAPGWPSRRFAQISSWIEFLVSIGLFRFVARGVEDPARAVMFVAFTGVLAAEPGLFMNRVARRRRTFAGKEYGRIRPEATFMVVEDRIRSYDAASGRLTPS